MQAVIIAAGESSRFWPLSNGIHKSQVNLLGKSLLYWTIKGFSENGIKDIVVVHRSNSSIPQILKEENDLGIELRFVAQKESLGPGDAAFKAREYITQPFFLCHPNKVNAKFIVSRMVEQQKTIGEGVVLVGAKTQTPWDYGMIRFEGEKPIEIVENPEKGKEPSNMRTLGVYLLPPEFFSIYGELPRHHEADLIDAINLCLKEKGGALVEIEKDVPALKYPWELFGILDILFHSENFQPRIHETAKIGENVTMKGDVSIGANTVIKENTVIEGPCFIGENCEIGYSNVLRGPLDIEKNVKTGAFCQIKHSIIQEGTHSQSGFIGDSIVGRNCRFGAGLITANRRFDRKNIAATVGGKKVDTGASYFGVVVGEGTHFGIHSGTMPGVLIGKECVVYPGLHVFENMPDNSLLKS